jgi:hypothetical protein
MVQRFTSMLRREEGGIATYVASAVMIMAVLGVAFLIIAASSNMGRFIVDRIYNFMTHAPK